MSPFGKYLGNLSSLGTSGVLPSNSLKSNFSTITNDYSSKVIFLETLTYSLSSGGGHPSKHLPHDSVVSTPFFLMNST